MANTSSVNLIDLDFFNQKSNIKNYLRNQKQFKDYDFDSSTINVLLDVLTYNTTLNLFYTNMLMSESWIDTAQVRGSIISHAKELNYTPRSAKSAKARIKVDFTATSENQPYVIPKGSTISAVVKDNNFVFTIPETISVSSTNTSFSFESDIYEGIYVQDVYTFNQENEEIPRFRLTNKNVDTDSLEVTVYTDGSTNGVSYAKTSTLLDLNYKSKVYFLQCSPNEYYEIYFGDDVLGKKPSNYSTIALSYRLSSGEKGNGARKFVLNFNPTGNESELIGTVDVSTIEVSKGGAYPETSESIRYTAPRSFQVQERTIGESDYDVALSTQFPEIKAVYAYGGEKVRPPRYGRVFIAVDIENVSGFPESKKQEYLRFLEKRKPFTIKPIFVEPEYSYLSLKPFVRYNLSSTKLSASTIGTLVKNVILSYRDNYLDDFNVTYRNSNLIEDINNADQSIVSTDLNVSLYKKVTVQTGTTEKLIVDFNLELEDSLPAKGQRYSETDLWAVTTQPFIYKGLNAVYEDDGDGYMNLLQISNNQKIRIAKVGTVDYKTGMIKIERSQIDQYTGDSLKFYCKPKDKDITVVDKTILTIEPSEINITVEDIKL